MCSRYTLDNFWRWWQPTSPAPCVLLFSCTGIWGHSWGISTFLSVAHFQNSETQNQFWKLFRKQKEKSENRIFRALKLLCMILKWWIHVTIHLSEPKECTTPRVSPYVNDALWVIMMCLCRFTNCNTYATLVGDADGGGGGSGGCVCGGAHGMWELPILSS